jgi:hypothetical protein
MTPDDTFLLLANLEVDMLRRLVELQESRQRRLQGRVTADPATVADIG